MKIKKFIKNNSTLLLLSLFVLVFSFAIASSVKIDNDFFWHIKAGEYMSKHGVLTKDVFSWYMYGQNWMSHEWLFEVIVYNLSMVFGNYFYILFSFVCIGILELILFTFNKNKLLNNVPFTMLWIICGFIFVYFVQVRPHLISYVFLAITMFVLYDLYRNEYSRKIYILPILSIIWANIHGGSSNLCYLLCFIFLLVGLFSFKFTKIEALKNTKRQTIKYFVVMILSMLAVCINVHGTKIFLYPYQNMADSLMLSNISEWRPTVLNDINHYPYFVLAIFILFVFIFSKKKIQLIDFVMLGISLFLGLKSIRFWPFTYIIMSFVVFDYVGKRKIDKGTNLCILFVSLFLIVFTCCNYKGVTITNDLLLDDKVIDILHKEKPERLYNAYDYGGILIYNDVPVFIDGRADLYSKYNYKDYLDISILNINFPKLIEKYNFDYFLVSGNLQINTYLKYCDEYELIYHNKKKNFYLYKTKKVG